MTISTSISGACHLKRKRIHAQRHSVAVRNLPKRSISVSDLQIELPGTLLRPSSLSLCFNGYSDIPNAFINGSNRLKLQSDKVTLSDFRSFVRPLGAFSDPMNLSLDAEATPNG